MLTVEEQPMVRRTAFTASVLSALVERGESATRAMRITRMAHEVRSGKVTLIEVLSPEHALHLALQRRR